MTYKIELTEQDLKVLNMAIGEIAFKVAAPLVEKINKQITEQQQQTKE